MMQRSVVMEGSLDEFDLVSVVQTVSLGRQCTGVELRDPRGAVVGSLLLKAGQIVAANAAGVSGVEAVRRLLRTPKSHRFYVYRARGVDFADRVGPVTGVLAQILAQPSTRKAPAILMQGSLGQYDMRSIAEAVSLGRQNVGIEVFAPDGRRVGALYLKGGQILFAAWGRSAGEAALQELFKPRKNARFIVFRRPEARVGEPLARLSDVLYPQPKTPKLPHPDLARVADEDGADPGADDEQTLVRAATSPSTPAPRKAPSIAPGASQALAAPGPRSAPDAARSVPPPAASAARKSAAPLEPPPIPEDAKRKGSQPPHPQSETPAAPRFRRSDTPTKSRGSLLLDEPEGPPRVGSAGPLRTPVLCINSPKGGVGRTTVTLNLAVSLARRGRRVIVVDADAEGLLPALNAAGRAHLGAADVLEARVALGDALLETRVPGLMLLPSGELTDATYRHSGWAPLLASLAAQSDIVLIDCAPAWYGATPTVLACATHQLTVVAAEPNAQRSCSRYQARLLRLVENPPNALGVLINMLDYQLSASLRAFEEVCTGDLASLVFDTTIPRSPAFMEASARGLPIVHADQGASPTIAWVFETLATAVLERLQLQVPSFASPLLA